MILVLQNSEALAVDGINSGKLFWTGRIEARCQQSCNISGTNRPKYVNDKTYVNKTYIDPQYKIRKQIIEEQT